MNPPLTASPSSAPDVAALSAAQLARLSGVSDDDLTGLVDFGVLTPLVPDQLPWTFNEGCVATLQRANTLRDDLALDGHAFALAVMFLQQISGLEAEQRHLRAELVLSRAAAHVADQLQ